MNPHSISSAKRKTGRANYGLPSALDEKRALYKRLRERTPAIFLDYDGTLTPIAEDPSRARLDERARRIVQRLTELMFVAVISGRGLDDIRRMMGIDGLVYAGSHGFEMSVGSGYFKEKQLEEHYLAALEKAEAELSARTENLAGVHIERKRFAIAVHYRSAGEITVAHLGKKVDEVAGRFAELRKTSGKKIFELRPAVNWDKGKAVQAMLEQVCIDCSRVLPLYIGDDTSDEDAFRTIAESGIPILVSDRPRPTAARFMLRNPLEVVIFLEKLVEMAANIR